MKKICYKLVRYLHDTLGIRLAVTPWANEHRLPLFLRERYCFFTADIFSCGFLFMVDTRETGDTPAAIHKHIDLLQDKWMGAVIYVRERITSYNRRRLIEQRIPFIIPGTQMYLPPLGVDLREHFQAPRRSVKGLRPATQVVLLHALLQDDKNMTPTRLAARLGYAVMTMSRALEELEAANLGETVIRGRERWLHLTSCKQNVWDQAQAQLRSPIVKMCMIEHPINAAQHGFVAGLHALSHYSMLSAPKSTTVALSRADWPSKRLKEHPHVHYNVDEPHIVNVEIWGYDPALFAKSGVVDRLSLYLTLREEKDERVQLALDQMIKGMPW